MSDETTGPTHPAAEGEYLSAAANWLALAEETHAMDSSEQARTFAESTRLAELNIAMAEACRRYRITREAPPAADEAMAAMRDRIEADRAAHEDVRLTAADPEPESTTGDLWIDDANAAGNLPFLYKIKQDRWTWVTDYAEALKYPGEGEPWATALDGGYVVRRTTDDERARFYAPELEPKTAPPEPLCGCCVSGLFSGAETCDDCGHGPEEHDRSADAAPTPPEQPLPVRHVQAEQPKRDGAWLESLSNGELATVRDQASKLLRRRSQGPRIGGGATQWNG